LIYDLELSSIVVFGSWRIHSGRNVGYKATWIPLGIGNCHFGTQVSWTGIFFPVVNFLYLRVESGYRLVEKELVTLRDLRVDDRFTRGKGWEFRNQQGFQTGVGNP